MLLVRLRWRGRRHFGTKTQCCAACYYVQHRLLASNSTVSVDPTTNTMNISDTGSTMAPWTGVQDASIFVRCVVLMPNFHIVDMLDAGAECYERSLHFFAKQIYQHVQIRQRDLGLSQRGDDCVLGQPSVCVSFLSSAAQAMNRARLCSARCGALASLLLFPFTWLTMLPRDGKMLCVLQGVGLSGAN